MTLSHNSDDVLAVPDALNSAKRSRVRYAGVKTNETLYVPVNSTEVCNFTIRVFPLRKSSS